MLADPCAAYHIKWLYMKSLANCSDCKQPCAFYSPNYIFTVHGQNDTNCGWLCLVMCNIINISIIMI